MMHVKTMKLYVVRKYIRATSAAQAIRLDRERPVDDVWIDDEWKKSGSSELASAVGFNQPSSEL